MYYYPYYLHLLNLLSFKHYNILNTKFDANIKSNINNPKTVDLWSITRTTNHKVNKQEYVASYNYYTQNYEFNGKRFLSYEDIINEALKI